VVVALASRLLSCVIDGGGVVGITATQDDQARMGEPAAIGGASVADGTRMRHDDEGAALEHGAAPSNSVCLRMSVNTSRHGRDASWMAS